MNIRYKDNNVDLSIEDIDGRSIANVGKILDLLKNFSNKDDLKIPTTKKQDVSEKSKLNKVVEDRPAIRERIPNEIDVSELNITKADTEQSMIRCPKCGQSSKAIVELNDGDSYYLRRQYSKSKKEEFSAITKLSGLQEIFNMCKPDDANIIDYHNDIMKIKIPSNLKDVDLCVDSNTIIRCPICKDQKNFSDWSKAFKYPLKYGFESDILCDVCGGEAVEIITKDGNKEIKCEHCKYSKSIVQ